MMRLSVLMDTIERCVNALLDVLEAVVYIEVSSYAVCMLCEARLHCYLCRHCRLFRDRHFHVEVGKSTTQCLDHDLNVSTIHAFFNLLILTKNEVSK